MVKGRAGYRYLEKPIGHPRYRPIMQHIIIRMRVLHLLVVCILANFVIKIQHNYLNSIYFNSLLVSDDNSSIQSSPWQRDHCWKQASPRRNISKEMNLFFRRANDYNLAGDSLALVRNKKRRPYDASSFRLCFQYYNGKASVTTDTVDGKNSKTQLVEDKKTLPADKDDTKVERIFGARKKVKSRNNLTDIIQMLIDKIPTSMLLVSNLKPNSITNNSNLSTRSEIHQTHVSPRKRILRELEKVSLEDLSTMKKSRAKSITNSSNISQAIGTAPQTISFPHPNSSILNLHKSNGEGSGGGARSSDNHISVISQPVSRPISSYSITSLLSHNNQVKQETLTHNKQVKQETLSHNNHVKQETLTSHIKKETPATDPSQLRAMLTSPKSPEYVSQRQYITSTSFDKKKSPNSLRNSNVSPKTSSSVYTHRSPSVIESTAQLNCYGLVRSPGLSPSPEQQQNMYRYRSHYGGHHSTVTSTNSSSPNFHPYMSSSSRCSPSSISPSSDALNNRYRSGYLLGSPNHQNYSNNNSSPSSYSRHSPLSGYHQKSPQPKYINHSPTHHLNNLNLSMNKIKEDLSPCNSPNLENQHEQLLPSSARTVPKKTATLRQQHCGVSLSSVNNTASDPYYKTQSINKDMAKYEMLSKSSDDGRKTFENKSHSKEFDYFSNINNCGMDSIDPRLIVRPPIIPSSPMFLMYPQHSPSAIPPSTHSSYLQYYQSMSYASAAAAAAYRNPLWMHYQNVPPSSRNPSMVPFGESSIEPNMHSASNLWGPVQHQSLPVDPLTLIKIKDESISGI